MSTSNQILVDLPAIKRNFKRMKNLSQDASYCMAVVKADAYGLGAVEISKYLADDADAFCVAIPEEAKELRDGGIEKPILCLGYMPEEWDNYFIDQAVRPAIFNVMTAERINKKAEIMGVKAPVHLALDTGHARIGFMWNDPETIKNMKYISSLSNLEIEGIFSHFATADEEDPEFFKAQQERFNSTIRELEGLGIKIPIKHLSNDAGIMRDSSISYDGIRIGIGMYGCYPSEFIKKYYPNDLEPVFSWRCKISNVKKISKGTSVSYGRMWTAQRDSIVATLQNGYADGYPRLVSNNAQVLIKGHRCPQVGRICMDQMMVDITDLTSKVQINDYAYLIGRSLDDSSGSDETTGSDKPITPDELANQASTISYEILTSIGKRVSRLYIK